MADRTALAHVTVKDTAGRYRASEHVTFGVPFAEGSLADLQGLRLWLDDGRPLDIQARPLSRWPDQSVRWALFDTRVEVQSWEEQRLTIGQAPDIAANSVPWRLHEPGDGSLLLDDGQTVWPVLSAASVGDAVVGMRPRLVDIFGHEYAGQLDRDSLEWLEWGPLRAVARVRGAHRALTDDGLSIDFHSFTVHAHFLAGRGLVRLEWTLENTPLENPPGRLAFESYELLFDTPQPPVGIQLPMRSVPRDAPFAMAQADDDTHVTVSEKRVAVQDNEDLWAGLIVDEEGAGYFVHRLQSFQNHPATLSYEPGDALRIGLLPAGAAQTFFLDDATRKTFRVSLLAPTSPGVGRDVMGQLSWPAHVSLPPAEVLATQAWGDAGHFYVPGPLDLSSTPSPPSAPPTGWADYGESAARNTHNTGSPRNKLSIFFTSMQTGRADLFQWSLSRAWHAMDLRPYHLRGFRAADFPWANLYEGLPHGNNKPEHSLDRAGIDSRFPEYKQDLPSGGHGYNGFDPEHMTLDDVYECYLLTGSWLALDALSSAGEAMLTWKELIPNGYIHSSRTFGWTLRALVQVFRATGEQRYMDAARRYVKRADDERGKGTVKYLRRMWPDARHLADRYYDAPFMVAVALHGLAAYWDETGDPRVPPMATDLVAFCLSAYREGGFLPDLPTEEPLDIGGSVSALGVGTWIPGAIAAAAFITGDHEPVDKVLPYYALLKQHSSRPVEFTASDWHWWQPYLASLQSRYGDGVVADPQGFLDSQAGKR